MSDHSVTTTPSVSQGFPDPIPGVIPFGSVCVVAGASGAGKTILFADWLQRMRVGKTICGHPTNPATAYYVIAADRDWSTYHKAYTAAGFPDVNRYVLAEDPAFDPQSWGRKHSAFTLFERCLSLINPIPGSWVNVDPVAPLFIQGNQNDARDVALSLHWYRKMALKYQITLALFANVAKQRSEETYNRPQDRIAGSGAFVAYSDTQVYLSRDDEGLLTVGWVPRFAAAAEFQFTFDSHSRLFQLQKAVVPGVPDHLARILALIPDDGITSPELVRKVEKELGLKRSTVFKHVQTLIEQGYVERSKLGLITRLRTPGQTLP